QANRIGRSGGKEPFERIDQAHRIPGFAADTSPAPRSCPIGCPGLNGHHISAMTLKFITTAANGDDITAMLADFAASIGLDRLAPGGYSFAWVLGFLGGFKSGHQNPAKTMREIEALEGIGPPSRLKPPGQFNRPPLKGLWHKHHLEDGLRGTAINALKG